MDIFESLKEFFISAPVLTIPLWQVLAFVMVVSLAAVFEKPRMVLILSYIFALYWVFLENLKILALNEISMITILIFLICGVIALVLSIYHTTGTPGQE